MFKKLTAEFIGTFWLIFIGSGSGILATAFPQIGIGIVGISFSAGIALMAMIYTIGGVSGGHMNPAVSVGLAVAGKFPAAQVLPYAAAQVAGALAAAATLYLVASGKAGFVPGGFGANGYGELSPGGYSMTAALVTEVVLMALFLFVILGSIHERVPAGFAPVAIGLSLTAINLVSIPITNTSLNPARSTALALFAQTGALSQLWLFWLAPMLGALIGTLTWRAIGEGDDAESCVSN
ncbi:aquaporin Z [Shinella curvata]|uniref:Aquaporin Z n=1 Tax=Shinella curvata TaxID=1817964 RepID=A0ABT8X7P9_9HYPH|nr:aquaporin Z [Shinella curvata]MCJ8052379.1 aquaporin Z [Shinella curvata]MDO6119672.1 aquaporin Z [Shinella curvata]